MKKLSLIALAVLAGISGSVVAANEESAASSLLINTVAQPESESSSTKPFTTFADVEEAQDGWSAFEDEGSYDDLEEKFKKVKEWFSAEPINNNRNNVYPKLVYDIKKFYEGIAGKAIDAAVAEAKKKKTEAEAAGITGEVKVDVIKDLEPLKGLKAVTDKMTTLLSKVAKEVKDEKNGRPHRLIIEELNDGLATLNEEFKKEVAKFDGNSDYNLKDAAKKFEASFNSDREKILEPFVEIATEEHLLSNFGASRNPTKPASENLINGANRYIDDVASVVEKERKIFDDARNKRVVTVNRVTGDIIRGMQNPAQLIQGILSIHDLAKDDIETARLLQALTDDKQNLRILENRLSINQHEIRLNQHDLRLNQHDLRLNQHDLRLNQHDLRIGILEQKFEKLDKKVNRGFSQLAAMSSVDLGVLDVRELGVGVGVGSYASSQAIALGVGFRPTANFHVNFKVAASPEKASKPTFGAGVVYKFKF
ncbi:hypothetical protein GVX81_05660 [[Haemophilus] felis]|uniref:Trimeric autotransporter adhesin YadA-like C-terminal membrane anchor domain-containing protein n=1 Tax=[Haemophilus] felis TaxID=123822 RepID=A0A1T0B7M5_9PAST|nr:hypothetical protein [[Haemophilus] felis]NBI40752.1 hypothetical protein [[Haemophilus] felis]OOS06203.1 hypothetical protein B0188_02485 [[Haemophilus] felis]